MARDAHAPLHPMTNAFSKKVENHAYAVALHMMYYDVVRIQRRFASLRRWASPIGLWEISDIVKLVEDAAAAPKKPQWIVSGPWAAGSRRNFGNGWKADISLRVSGGDFTCFLDSESGEERREKVG